MMCGFVLAIRTTPSPFAPSPAQRAAPATRNSRSDSLPIWVAASTEFFDLGLLATLQDVGLAAAGAYPGTRYELDVPNPQRDAALRHTESVSDVQQDHPVGAQHPRLLLLRDLASITHEGTPFSRIRTTTTSAS
jgi:hypothetical protein